jgi:hypothetical protein
MMEKVGGELSAAAWGHNIPSCVATRHPTAVLPHVCPKQNFREKLLCPFDFSQELRHLEINGAAGVC